MDVNALRRTSELPARRRSTGHSGVRRGSTLEKSYDKSRTVVLRSRDSPTSASVLDGRVAKIDAALDSSIDLFFGITSRIRPLLCEVLATLMKIRPARAASRVDADPTSFHKPTPTLMYKLLR